MVLLQLLSEHPDCARLVVGFLTRRQALLASAACKHARLLILELLGQSESPFRKTMVIASSQPGRLLEVDVLPGMDSNRTVMWNSWVAEQPRKFRKRKRLGPRKRPATPWVTGICDGPTAWEPIRAAAAAVASGAAAGSSNAGAHGTGNGESAAPGTGSAAQVLRFQPMGPTIYACCYSIPGIAAFDSTTLLPLGVLVTFKSQQNLAEPEGVCASSDHLYVLCCQDCTVSRIGLQPLPVAYVKKRHSRYGGALSYGGGVVLATITAGMGWVGWGVALAPDGGALYCAVDRPYNVANQLYTQAPPPRTSGNVICVPLECLGVRGRRHVAVMPVSGIQLSSLDAGGLALRQPGQPQPPWIVAVGETEYSLLGSSWSPVLKPYTFVHGPAVLRRPSGLCFSPDGSSLWVTSYDTGIVEVAGPTCGPLAGTVLRVVPLPLPPPSVSLPPSRTPVTELIQSKPSGAELDAAGTSSPAASTPNSGSGSSRRARRRSSISTAGTAAGGCRGGCVAAVKDRGRGSRQELPRVMLAWDLCWVPLGPRSIGPTASSGANCSTWSREGIAVADGSPAGPIDARLKTPLLRQLLCMTLHEDPSPTCTEPSGWECRVGVLVQGDEGWERGQAEPEACAEGRVAVRAVWRSTRSHLHPSMACVV